MTATRYASRVRRARTTIVVALVVALEIYGRLFADPAFMQPPSEILRAWFVTVLPDARIMSATRHERVRDRQRLCAERRVRLGDRTGGRIDGAVSGKVSSP